MPASVHSMRARQMVLIVATVLAAIYTYNLLAPSNSDVPPLPRCKDAIATGIDFTMDDIVLSSKLPNGTMAPLLVEQGDTGYRRAMRNVYEIAKEAAATQEVPAAYGAWYEHGNPNNIRRNPRQSWKAWLEVHFLNRPLYRRGHRDYYYPYYLADHDVAALKQSVNKARLQSERLLKDHHEVNVVGCSPYALITVPSFLVQTIDISVPHNFNERKVRFNMWEDALLYKFSRAVFEAGFNRALEPNRTVSIYGEYDERRDRPEHALSAPTYTVSTAAYAAACPQPIEACGDKRCLESHLLKTKQCCSAPGSFIVQADISSKMLYLSLRTVDGCVYYDPWLPWSVHTHLALQTARAKNGATAWPAKLQQALADYSIKVKNEAIFDSNMTRPRLFPTGEGWEPRRLEALRHAGEALDMQYVETTREQRVFSASLGSAHMQWSRMNAGEIYTREFWTSYDIYPDENGLWPEAEDIEPHIWYDLPH